MKNAINRMNEKILLNNIQNLLRREIKIREK